MRIHRAGHHILAASAALLFLFLVMILRFAPQWLFLLGSSLSLALYALMLYFFRASNSASSRDPNLLYSPAQGKIMAVERILEKQSNKISIYLSLFDLHMMVAPVSGKIVKARYKPGKYFLAFHPKASELNERQTIVMETDNGLRVEVRLIAGKLARRICCYVVEGQHVEQGEEIGFIRFGSRVDVFLPEDWPILVQIGQRVKLGQTALAMRPSSLR
jgi:phosphatidylserine decarboxylase